MNSFQQRKKDILSKKDKSYIGKWDEKIKDLCNKINSLDNYYTTSSCSGRIVIVIDQDKKAPGVFEFVIHDLISFKKLEKEIKKIKKDSKFKQEPPILHVACKTLKDAQILLRKAQVAGWKHSGIISLKRNIVVELINTEKLEFPLIKNGKILINNDFLEIVLEKSNENLKKGWLKIEKLQNSLK